MIAKSLLQSSARTGRGKLRPASSGFEQNDEVTLLSRDEEREYASWSTTAAAILSEPDFSLRALGRLTNRARVVDARGSTAGCDCEWLPHLEADDDAMRALRAACRGPARTKTVDGDVARLGGDIAGARVIFVVLMPKCVSDGRCQELAVEPLRQMPGAERLAAVNGPIHEVDLPSAMRQSAFRDAVLADLEPAGAGRQSGRPDAAPAQLPDLTPREREVLQLILEGHPNKNIAADLQISRRTVENHRAKLMKKTGSKSLPALVRLAIAAGAMPDASAGPHPREREGSLADV